ncbi:branched-chain amino acid ABC transporter permease/ATP-binding protein [Micromonospora polyrhachis]|uniref:ABC-type branched-subunit amino acid transport system ATPase component/ABC-type branched-subunit amino acid transport system permease subunit n=1 Tax=Micromonospora polyrhachis TaxID=1282883 RepID=A0A7W7WMU0_9ACTN|nr:ATP-binding cassette domain-containing protein [Micromonospora polyrhachis]MBB4956508.1 ABC-type branched-subunit amino acid transport system ATPase component/ABC-type branched-subunit amino acid transport system permease subunit [Micromonospora polyrhachis]
MIGGFDFGPDRILLGLFTGLTYGLLAVGLVLVYRSSRFVNFAHGAVGVFGAAVLGRLVTDGVLPYWLALPVGMLAAAAVSGAIELSVVRRLRHRPRVIGMIATLGLSQFVLVLALLVNSSGASGPAFPVPPGMPSFTVGNTPVGPAFTAMLLLTPALLVGLAMFLKRSRFGLAIRAAADAPDSATLNGVTAARMATLAWSIAGAVAAFSAILMAPTQGTQSIESLGPALLVRGLAGAVIARFSSVPIAFGASLGIGVGEQILLSGRSSGGLVELALVAVILVALLAQPVRSRRAGEDGGWGRIGAPPLPAAYQRVWLLRNLGRVVAGVGFAVATVLAFVISNETASVLIAIIGFTLVGLSIGLVTGVAGELSLGQFAFAGIGAAVSVQVSVRTGNLFLGMLAGCTAAALAAVAVGVPALRLRGLALAVTTLAFALATSAFLLRQGWLLGDGAQVPKPRILGHTFDLATDYYLLALVVLLLGLWVTANLRTGAFGRILVALRDNADAARAFTVAVPVRVLQAYAVAGALAGLGGAVVGHGQTQLTVNTFPASASIDVVATVVVGGITLLGGPLLGAFLIVGVPGFLELDIIGQAVLTLAWLVVVIALPAGLGGPVLWLRDRIAASIARGSAPVLSAADQVAGSGAEPEADEVAEFGAASGAGPSPAAAGSGGVITLPPRTVPLRPAVTGEPLLSVRGVARSYGGVRAVAGASLDVTAGEVVGIIGPNGAGKTTLFEIIAGFTRADRGAVRFAGRPVTGLSPQRRAGLGLVRSFQDARLFATMTVLETVMVAGERTAPTSLVAAALGATGQDRAKRRRAEKLVTLMGLAPLADRLVGELSTGTRRIVEITCLLALEPVLLLLDEPSSGVSQADGVALGEVLRRVHDELGVTMVIIEHDLPLLARLADRLVAMDSGRVIADGTPQEVRTHPDVVRSYLGTDHAAVHRSGVPAQRAGVLS